MPNLPLLIIGAGGHARVLVSTLLKTNRQIIGFLEADHTLWNTYILGLPVLGGDACLKDFPTDSIRLVNGIGTTASGPLRKKIFEQHKSDGFSFESVIHPTAYIAPHVELSEGVQIMAGVVIQVDTKIRDNAIINTGAIVDHDCIIGSHTHIAPGVTLSGGVVIGSNCHIGVGAVIVQQVEIGDESTVGAGAVVTDNHGACSLLLGVPAKMVNAK